MSGADVKWEEQRLKEKAGAAPPARGAGGRFARGNPGGGRPKEPAPPITLEEHVRRLERFYRKSLLG